MINDHVMYDLGDWKISVWLVSLLYPWLLEIHFEITLECVFFRLVVFLLHHYDPLIT